MPPTSTCCDLKAIDLAREALYRFLAAAFTDPRFPAAAPALNPADQRLAAAAADVLRAEAEADPVPLGFGERPAEDLDVAEAIAGLAGPADELAAAYDRAFGLVAARECPPYETEYCPNSEPFFRTQQMADVAGFYAAFGLTGSTARRERPDMLTRELEFMAHLLLLKRLAEPRDVHDPAAAERAPVCSDAARQFFRDHLSWWVPSFARGLAHRAEGGPYAALARVLAAFLPAERGRLEVKAPQSPVRPTAERPGAEEAGCAGCALAP
jgi:putative dimethyl sulfoxide reductase chaperone